MDPVLTIIVTHRQTTEDIQPFAPTNTTDYLKFPVCLIVMFMDCERKMENVERTHADTERTCKRTPHRKIPRPGIEPTTYMPCRNMVSYLF